MFQRGRFFCLLFFLAIVFTVSATHNRAGEIIYKRIAPFTKTVGDVEVPVYTYSITIIKYTADGTGIADRCVDSVLFGDGKRGVAPRVNGPTSGCSCGNFNGSPLGCGSIIINDPNYRVKVNIYTITHTYPSAGTYIIRSFDPNRNGDVHNIPNSLNLPFYVESMLIINSFTGANSSPVFAFAPIDKACLGICFEHNPGAYDPDGDSLSYEITTSRGVDGETVLGYFYPETGGGNFSINARTGLLTWCTPQYTDEYNIAFIVKEWRKSTNGTYQMIGYVLRDMQVIVNACVNHQQPEIMPIEDVCVEAGRQVDKDLTVKDLTNGDKITLIGGGGAFSGIAPIASLSPTVGTTFASSGFTFTSHFKWQTSCDHIRVQPYVTTIKAQDSGPTVKLVTFQTFNIQVIPPAVKNLSVTPIGTTMKIAWAAGNCNPAQNKLTGYKIYRKNDCAPFVPSSCQTGVPVSSGFVLVGQVTAAENSFIDDNNKDGLVVGQNYSYLVIAEYTDGSQSAASTQVCGELKRDVPVLTNVDVLTTNDTGTVRIKWVNPLTTPGNLNLSAFPGPYRYKLKHRIAPGDTFATVFTTTKAVFKDLEEVFTHSGINTVKNTHEYLLEFSSGTVSIGSSQKASSIFLITTPSDRRIDLAWTAKTPWNNYKYTVYRQDPGSTTFTGVATLSSTAYADKNFVENGKTYCYFIKSEGEYSDDSLPKPLINNSQISCSTAKDLTPPVAPTLSVEANCATGMVQVSWNDIRNESDDVGKYELYFKPTLNDEYSLISVVGSTQPLIYNPDVLTSISGCYAVRAIDINENIGAFSEDFCLENCPEFELPNIFTPNGDSINDTYKAIKVRQIKEIDLTITDRWGNLAYHTRDPYFRWDGKNTISHLPSSEGTFFYVCDVFEQRLKGVTKRTLKGYLQIAR